MTGLARLSLANRSLVIMIALVLGGVGAFAIPQLKQQLFPSLTMPMLSVVATYPGASPEIVEQQVTEPIENSLRGVEGVEEITSTSAESMSNVRIAFDFELDSDEMVADIEKAINGVKGSLPADVEPRVIAGSTDDIPVMALAVSSDGDQATLLDQIERHVVPELSGIADVKDVSISGAVADQITITPDTGDMAKAGVSPAQIPEVLQANGVAIPAGTLTEDGSTLSVQVGDKLTSVEDLEDLYLTPAASPAPGAPAAPKPVRLGDVATIELEPEEITSVTRTDGKPSLGLAITMTADGNAVAISHEVRDVIDSLASDIGDGAAITIVFDQAPYIESSIEDLTTEGLLGLIFAVIVIMLFLLSLRSTIVTAVSIPMSVVIALIALWAGDYSLNMLTLGALTISIGRVVDDSIVVLENIKRHLSYGEEKRVAVIEGVREVAGAVTASTLTTVGVFLPIAFVSGMVGQLFSSFAITVTVALLASLLVSLTIIPVLAYWFLKAPTGDAAERERIRVAAEEKELRSPLQRMYTPVLRFATRFKFVTVLIGIAVLVGTFALIPGLKTNFLDSAGQNTSQINQTLPLGTDLETTDAAAAKVEEILADTDGVESYQVNIGSGNPMFGGLGGNTNKASFSITIEEGHSTPDVEKAIREAVADLTDVGEVAVGMEGANQAMGGSAVEVIVQGGDADSLAEAAALVEAEMGDVEGLRDVTSNIEEAAPRVEVTVDREEAAAVGVTEAQLGGLIAQAFRGAPLGEIAIDGTPSQIVLSSGDDKPASVKDIEKLSVPTAAGLVEVGDIAEVELVDGPTEISRIDGERSASITAAADIADLGAITQSINDRLSELDLPDGTSYVLAGSSADQEEAFADLGLAMLIAIALVFMIMVATFRSFVQPLILLVSIPFAATGAIGLLRVTGIPLGVPAMIGLLMLIGIVVTNAIVLIDLINQYREQGMGIREAVIAGGRRRLRPILMTAIATVCALVPMALGFTGSGGFIAQSLAIVVIGGLVSSTLLTLLLVPTLYTIVENTKARFRRKPKTAELIADSSEDVEDAAPPREPVSAAAN
ncbi:efflux RND transporter permease subunit [Stackebrandtia soli]|uniref:efflux RND transporter permease subunit n=1 Tax=Stackebrandtia soli TaxID=1892856 RepID=UPI0039EBA768